MGAPGSRLRSLNPNWQFEVARQQNDYSVALIGMLNCIDQQPRLLKVHSPRFTLRFLGAESRRSIRKSQAARTQIIVNAHCRAQLGKPEARARPERAVSETRAAAKRSGRSIQSEAIAP